jgi:GT2 family glycosyltransferase
MYGEDIDWSYRFYKAGWKRIYFAGTAAFHYGGASSAVAPTRFYIEMRRANLQFCKKHYGAIALFALIAIIVLHECVRVAGNAALSVMSKSKRSRAMQNTRRSIECICWVMNQARRGGVTMS